MHIVESLSLGPRLFLAPPLEGGEEGDGVQPSQRRGPHDPDPSMKGLTTLTQSQGDDKGKCGCDG